VGLHDSQMLLVENGKEREKVVRVFNGGYGWPANKGKGCGLHARGKEGSRVNLGFRVSHPSRVSPPG
jgi:hypothetical protein